MTFLRSFALMGLLLAAAPAEAGKPGDAKVEEPDREASEQRIEIFDNNKAETICKLKGKVCVKASPSAESVGTDAAPAFQRSGGAKKGDWTLDLYGNFKKAALAGNAQFIFSDVQDSASSKSREVTGLYQMSVKAGNSISARARLSPDEGFRAGRTYRVQIVQLIGGKEQILAEATFKIQ